jgi:pyrroloquinoline quinone biosynthesis protein E
VSAIPRPYTLVAELTYRCPLRCAYCSTPLDWASHRDALDTAAWTEVFRQAEALGVVQVHLTGGEPLLRDDLEALVAAARRLDLYTHLVTSGVPFLPGRFARLGAAGLDAVQLSIQDVDDAAGDRIAGRRAQAEKREAARDAVGAGLPLTVNVVLHRDNLDRVDAFVAYAAEVGAHRIELANAQYLGWALANRAALLPTAAALARARATAIAARRAFRGRMEVVFVLPDYVADRPKPCMDGWGRRFLVVAPDGLVLPCHAAHTLPGLRFERATERPLADIWADSPAFAAFRGEAWMPEPCRSCSERARDFGGCRCQAHHLAGDAAATDPVCALAPRHEVVRVARAAAETAEPPPLAHRSPRA